MFIFSFIIKLTLILSNLIMNKRKIILVVFLFAESIFSQTNSGSFDKSAFAITYNKTSEHNGLETFWQIDNGFTGYFQTQFYIGDISLGLTHTSFNGNRKKYPDFSSKYLFLSWTGNLDLPLNSTLALGVKVGTFLMTFEGDTLNSFQKNESELAIGPYAILSFPLLSHFSLNLSSEFITVFTKRSMKFLNISAGVSYTFKTPDWLKRAFE